MLGDRADLAVSSVQQSILPGGRSHAAEVAEWFNTSAFQQNAPFTFGDTGKNILRGPRYFSTDLAGQECQAQRALRMEFRTEFFNAFNNVNFGRPDGNLADIGTTYGRLRDWRVVILEYLRNGPAPHHSIWTEVGFLSME
jgi:hypothetical protein